MPIATDAHVSESILAASKDLLHPIPTSKTPHRNVTFRTEPQTVPRGRDRVDSGHDSMAS